MAAPKNTSTRTQRRQAAKAATAPETQASDDISVTFVDAIPAQVRTNPKVDAMVKQMAEPANQGRFIQVPEGMSFETFKRSIKRAGFEPSVKSRKNGEGRTWFIAVKKPE